jgi:hypothetical protein
LRTSRRDDRNAYVERPVQSLHEGVMVLARISPALDRSDQWGPTVWPVPAVKSELWVVFRHGISIGFDSYWGKTSPPFIYEGPQSIEGTQSYLSLTSNFYRLNTFSNIHASGLLISTAWDGVLGPAGRPRARRRCPRPDGVPPGRELRWPLLVCS